MKKIIITGGNGLLGSKLIQIGCQMYEIFSIDIHEKSKSNVDDIHYIKCDVTDKKSIQSVIQTRKPDCIIHTAAYTNVDGCETHQQDAWDLNVEGTRFIAETCQNMLIKLIHLSTDYIFDGTNGPYVETDKPNPVSWYGKTKLESELIVQNLLDDYVIARTMVLFGMGQGIRPNFVTWLIDMLRQNKDVHIVNDQYGHATLADDLAAALYCLYEKEAKGIFHTAGRGYLNRYEMALKIAKVFHLNASLIHETTSDHFKQPAARPLKSGLNTDKIMNETGYCVLNFEESLDKMKDYL